MENQYFGVNRRLPFFVEQRDGYWLGRFQAMASPCEVLIETDNGDEARYMIKLAATEAWRIEKAFSRYRQDNIVYVLNNSKGGATKVDPETARLLTFADQCYQISQGLFDITSGILRKAWIFDGSDKLPSRSKVKKLLPFVGWEKVLWQPPYFTMQPGMEIDFGGIGKEYAVDRVVALLSTKSQLGILVNFGGDLHANQPRKGDRPWLAGIENPDNPDFPSKSVELYKGALTTSGDARRFLLKNGTRYSHILNPKTGWPIEHAPRSVTVAGINCTEAGILSTLALLQGKDAEVFLDAQQVRYWCIR